MSRTLNTKLDKDAKVTGNDHILPQQVSWVILFLTKLTQLPIKARDNSQEYKIKIIHYHSIN